MRPLLLLPVLALLACGEDRPRPLRSFHSAASRHELRPTDTSSTLMWRFLATDTVENFDSADGGFRVHYTRAGKNAVPPADTNANSVPDFVETVAGVYDQVADRYQKVMGFRAPLGDGALPNNGGNARFDVYLLDFALSADGALRTDQCLATNPEQCITYVVQENDFVGYSYPNATVATRILGSHEYFHGIQAAYDSNQDVVISEGSAVWATEQFDPSTNDLEGFIDGYLNRPDRPLDSPPPGPVPAFAYGSGIFFQFLSEKYGPVLVRQLWERCENGQGHPSEPADLANPRWMIQLDALLKAQGSSFAVAFRTFATWNLFTGAAASPADAYANGVAYPAPAMTAVTLPYQSAIPLRVFYASTLYFRTAPAGRTEVGAALVDDSTTPEDETSGLALVLVSRKLGANQAVLTAADVKAGVELLPTVGAQEVVVAVVNTARDGVAALSRRPGLCIGTAAEIKTCHLALDPSFDAGVDAGFDAGFDGGVDAGPGDAGPPDAGPPDAGFDAGTALVDGGVDLPLPPRGCGCSGTPAGFGALALAWLLRRRRQAASNCRSTSRL